VPRPIDRSEALERLARQKRELLGDGDGCVMCALAGRARSSPDRIAESPHGVVLLDRFGRGEGHMLVMAREHFEHAHELGWPEYADLQRLAHEACVALRRTLEPVRTFLAVLGAPTQLPMSFPHFHIHVLPVYHGDERARPAHVFSWGTNALCYEDAEAHELCARLRDNWPVREAT
jgi:diadenosine tetraphosphate (Ap4A) HIT family hydrolase